MQKQPLAKLLKDIEQEMIRLHYTKGTLTFYRRRWKMLTKFAKERGETEYSEQLGFDFVEHHFGLLKKDAHPEKKKGNALPAPYLSQQAAGKRNTPLCH
ncbi:hypothetical protein [Pelotomaculum propionicicum]|uniref:hypothetical protein n=1 Tax=Pelotomaculum propionicicum TaxID=258475 RepID=UPI0010669545|nr:hypothetical protein [Pelotomaculum propionicicum]